MTAMILVSRNTGRVMKVVDRLSLSDSSSVTGCEPDELTRVTELSRKAHSVPVSLESERF